MGAAAGPVSNVVGLGFDIFGQGMEMTAEARQNKFAVDALGQNARIAAYGARTAAERGAQDEFASRAKYGALRGEQTTALGASGVSASSGSALDILANTEAMSEYDAKVIHANAARDAWTYRMKQQELLKQKGLLKQAGEDQRTAGTMKILSSTLAAAGNMAGGMGGKGG